MALVPSTLRLTTAPQPQRLPYRATLHRSCPTAGTLLQCSFNNRHSSSGNISHIRRGPLCLKVAGSNRCGSPRFTNGAFVEVAGSTEFPAQISSDLKPLQASAISGLVERFASLITTLQGTFPSSGDAKLTRTKAGSLRELALTSALVSPGFGTTSSDSVSHYTPTMYDSVAGIITLCGALGFLRFFNELAKRDVLDKKLSRKLVHIVVGLGFMLFWPLFTTAPQARYLAAFAPAANGIRMLAVGFGLLKNEAIVKSMTREGDRRELLRGPFYYALAVVATTVGFWRTSPVGIVALVNLCAGDGFADIIGRNFGTSKLPWNINKSYAGSLGFFIMSTFVSMLYLSYFSAFGLIEIFPGTLVGVLLVSLLTATVESLPISTEIDDNFTVPFTAMALGMFFLPDS